MHNAVGQCCGAVVTAASNAGRHYWAGVCVEYTYFPSRMFSLSVFFLPGGF